MLKPFVVAAAAFFMAQAGLSFVSDAHASALTIGSFGPARGGVNSLKNAGSAKLRSSIKKAFPGSTFMYANRLTPAFLSGVQVIVIGVAFADMNSITPLSAREQKALLKFVKSGGTALLLADNNDQFQTASNSLVSVFGLATDGFLAGVQTAGFESLKSDPIQAGPFGMATQFDTSYPGWFTNLGPATEIAQLNSNAEAEIAYIRAGTLGSKSGSVVLFADTTSLADSFRTQNDLIVLLNSLALAQ